MVVPGVGSKFVVAMHIPVLVNTVPVKKGDELLMEAPPKQAQYHIYKTTAEGYVEDSGGQEREETEEGFRQQR